MIIRKKRKIVPGKEEAIVLPVFENSRIQAGAGDFPEWAEALLKFKIMGRPGRDLVFYSDTRKCWLMAIGAGRTDRLNDARKLAKKIVSRLKENRVRLAVVDLRQSGPFRFEYLVNLVDYLHLNDYRFDRYLRKKDEPLRRLELVLTPGSPLAARDIGERDEIGRNVRWARDLVNDIPARINPDSLVRTFLDMAKEQRPEGESLEKSGTRKTENERPSGRRRIFLLRTRACIPGTCPEGIPPNGHAGGQGDLLRFRGAEHQDRPQHGRDEMRHGRSGAGGRNSENRIGAEPSDPRDRPGGDRREHAGTYAPTSRETSSPTPTGKPSKWSTPTRREGWSWPTP